LEYVDGAAGVGGVKGAAGIRDVIRFFFDHRALDSSMVEDVEDAERRGMIDADGSGGVNDVGGVAGVNDVGRDSARANQIDGIWRG